MRYVQLQLHCQIAQNIQRSEEEEGDDDIDSCEFREI